MATLTEFEEIEAWQQARQLNRLIYRVTKTGRFSKDYELKNQIRRASISAMSNIAEGFERGGTNEFIHFLGIAKGSVGEVESQLYVALDESYITEGAVPGTEGHGNLKSRTTNHHPRTQEFKVSGCKRT